MGGSDAFALHDRFVLFRGGYSQRDIFQLFELKDDGSMIQRSLFTFMERFGVAMQNVHALLVGRSSICVTGFGVIEQTCANSSESCATLGMSRDDYGTFIRHYQENDIVARDPFQTIDMEGVGGLMKIAVEKGRTTRPDLKIGICGEHGGEPDSVKFCHKIGLNYVSCSPFRVPVARLAAAQAALAK